MDNSQIEVMYYDAFANEYVLHKDPYAPPERYVKAVRTPTNIYIEYWQDENGACLNIEYNIDDYYSEQHDVVYREACEKHNFTPSCLRMFGLPSSKFDEYVVRFGLRDKGEQV